MVGDHMGILGAVVLLILFKVHMKTCPKEGVMIFTMSDKDQP
jgi:hypothetical protein